MAPPDSPRQGTLDAAIPAIVAVLAGLTLLFTGFVDLSAGETIIRERGKKDVVARAVGPLASTFDFHVWGSLVLGAILAGVGVGLLLYLRLGSDAGREKLFAYAGRRNRFGNARRPPWAAQIAAVLFLLLVVWILTSMD